MNWKKICGILAAAAVAVVIVMVIAVVVFLKSDDYNRLKPMITGEVKRITGRDLIIGGDLDLTVGLAPSIVMADVAFRNADWGSRPDMITLKRLEVQTALISLFRREIVIKRFVLVEPDILIEKDASGKSNLDFGMAQHETVGHPETQEPTDDAGFVLSVNDVEIKGGRLAFKNAAMETIHAVQIDTLKLTPSASVASGLTAELKGAYNEQAFTLRSDFGGFAAFLDPKRTWPLDLTLQANQTRITVSGDIRDATGGRGFTLAVQLEADSLAGLPGLAPNALPDVGPFKVALSISDPEVATYQVSDLSATFRDSAITGSATLKLGGERPHIIAEIAAKHLDLRPLSRPGKNDSETSPVPKARADKVFPADPLPLEAFSAMDVDLKARIDRLLLPALALSPLSVDLILKNGTLIIEPVKAGLGDGQLEGRISLATRRNKADISAVLKMSRIDAGRMMQELNAGDILEGTLDGNADFKGAGESVAAIMAGLDGRMLLKMGAGRLNNRYLGFLGIELTTGVIQLFDTIRKASKYADINCMVLNTEVAGGIARISPLVADTTNASVIGEGRVNLKTETLDVGFKTFPKQGAIGMGVSLSELTKLVNLTGTLAHPTLGIDTYQTTLAVGKAVGGAMLYGPAGIAMALLTQRGSENPCLDAIEKAEAGAFSDSPKKNAGEKAVDSVKKIGESIGGAIKGIFGR